MARLPQYWQAKSGVREVRKTTYTTRMGRWLKKRGMKDWNPRLTAQAKNRSTAKPSRRKAKVIELDAGADILTHPPQPLMGIPYDHDPYGHDPYQRENPYTNAAHIGAGSSPFGTDDAWVTTRETSVLPDPDINAPPNQYPLPPSYHGTDDAWAMSRETSILPDLDIDLSPNQYPLPPSYHHPPFDFSLRPPTYPNDHFHNMFNGGLDDDDDDNDDDDGDIFGPEGDSAYWDPSLLDPSILDPEMVLDDPFEGLVDL